jgi:uncharacterized cupin superfamily protein
MSSTICSVDAEGPEGKGLPVDENWEHLLTVVEGGSHFRGYSAYSDPTRQFSAGVSECESGVLKLHPWPKEEFCVVISGSVEITDEQNHTEKFGPGDAFVIPKGFAGTWYMPQPMKHYWVVYNTPGDNR